MFAVNALRRLRLRTMALISDDTQPLHNPNACDVVKRIDLLNKTSLIGLRQGEVPNKKEHLLLLIQKKVATSAVIHAADCWVIQSRCALTNSRKRLRVNPLY